MSYKCGICGNSAKKGEQQLRHVIERVALNSKPYRDPAVGNVYPPEDRKEIAKEIPVCSTCHGHLKVHSLNELVQWHSDEGQLQQKAIASNIKKKDQSKEIPAEPKPQPKKSLKKEDKPVKNLHADDVHIGRGKRKSLFRPVCEYCGVGLDKTKGDLIEDRVQLCKRHR